MGSAFQSLDAILALLVVDLLLSGDNAMVIALACRSLPPVQKRQAMLIGTGGAVVLRVLLTTVAGFLLQVPLLKLTGGVLLVAIAIKLLLDEDGETDAHHAGPAATDLWTAVATVVTADLIMSLDNVVGLAAVAQGSVTLLVLGLLISMPLLMFGSLFVANLLARYPLMVRGGGALLGWVAGDIAMSDALIADWVNQQSPALKVVVPALTAAFVLLQSRIIERRRPALAALRQRLDASAAPVPPRQHQASPSETAPPMQVALPSASLPPTTSHTMRQSHSPAAPLSAPVPARSRRWLRVAGGLALAMLVIIPSIYVDFWMPSPAHLQTYDCASSRVTLAYHEGGAALHLMRGPAFASGTVDAHHHIQWGDYGAVATALGAAPPTSIQPAGPQAVQLAGGSFDQVECRLPAAAAPGGPLPSRP